MTNIGYRLILAALPAIGSSALANDFAEVRVTTAKTRYYPGDQV